MDEEKLQQVADLLMQRLFVELEASGRHVHVTKEQAKKLFGHGLTPKRPLSQPGQYLAEERVTVIGPKGKFENVAVLGPERKSAQVEVSLTDARALGLSVPVRLSGDTAGSPGATLEGSRGTVTVPEGVLCAKRHIHVKTEDARVMGLQNGQTVKLRTYTQRPTVFCDVAVRVSDDFETRVHLDYDEANACGFRNGDLGSVIQ